MYSRDEKKQEDQRLELSDRRIKYYIGDVRDLRSLETACRGVDFIYHAAALKQVPSCEFHPMEAVATNVLGTEQRAGRGDPRRRSAGGLPVDRQGGLSDQRHGHVQGADGEGDIAKARSAIDTCTTICGTRYGNVLASRGSVVPLFIKQVGERAAADHHRSGDDALRHDARRGGRSRAVRVRARRGMATCSCRRRRR